MRTHPSPRRHAALVLGLLCTGALASGCAADFISYELPEEPARYTLEVDSRGGVHTTWEYTSQGVDEDANPDEQPCIGEMFGFQAPDTPCRPEPLIFLQYDLNLALDNTAPAATTHKVTVTAYYQERLDSTPTVTDLQVEASFDDGGTWATVPVRRVGDGVYEVTITHPALGDASGTVGLRVSAADDQGNTVRQTVPHAYRLR
ncbi:MAG TPA: hypothetical protein VKY81_01725 [Natronosporangium sp.]|nr:hypothetical protein [Natronosporangium sp.]